MVRETAVFILSLELIMLDLDGIMHNIDRDADLPAGKAVKKAGVISFQSVASFFQREMLRRGSAA